MTLDQINQATLIRNMLDLAHATHGDDLSDASFNQALSTVEQIASHNAPKAKETLLALVKFLAAARLDTAR